MAFSEDSTLHAFTKFLVFFFIETKMPNAISSYLHMPWLNVISIKRWSHPAPIKTKPSRFCAGFLLNFQFRLILRLSVYKGTTIFHCSVNSYDCRMKNIQIISKSLIPKMGGVIIESGCWPVGNTVKFLKVVFNAQWTKRIFENNKHHLGAFVLLVTSYFSLSPSEEDS